MNQPTHWPVRMDRAVTEQMDKLFDAAEPYVLCFGTELARYVVGYAMKPTEGYLGDFDLEVFSTYEEAQRYLRESVAEETAEQLLRGAFVDLCEETKRCERAPWLFWWYAKEALFYHGVDAGYIDTGDAEDNQDWECPDCGQTWVTTPGHERCLHCDPEQPERHLQSVPLGESDGNEV
jgi:hypothetical protein